jgi:hypothetical protein
VKTKEGYRLIDLWCLLSPGLRYEVSEVEGVDGMLVPVFASDSFDIVLWHYPRDTGLNEQLLTAEEIQSNAYKDLFRPRVLAAIDRLKAMPARDSV